jgi:hypothetical protein
VKVTNAAFKEMQKKKQEIADAAKIAIKEVKLENEKINLHFRQKEAEIDQLRYRIGEEEVLNNQLKSQISESTKIEQKVKLLENKYVVEICALQKKHEKEIHQKDKEVKILK